MGFTDLFDNWGSAIVGLALLLKRESPNTTISIDSIIGINKVRGDLSLYSS